MRKYIQIEHGGQVEVIIKKIFYKDIENEKGKYAIDILLDSSGSQSRNQANVATQAYIIARALTMW